MAHHTHQRCRSGRLVVLLLFSAFTFLANSIPGRAQESRIYLNPEFSLGCASGYKHSTGMGLDPSGMNRTVRLEVKGGYRFSPNVALFTGFGYASYHYQLAAPPPLGGADTVRAQSEEFWEVPIGVRISSYHGHRSMRTRVYAAAGVRLCFLDDARHDYHTADKIASDVNIVRPSDFNSFWVRMFAEGGLDIPMDYDSAITLGLCVSSGVSRNMSEEGALSRDNYGVLALSGCIGVRFGF